MASPSPSRRSLPSLPSLLSLPAAAQSLPHHAALPQPDFPPALATSPGKAADSLSTGWKFAVRAVGMRRRFGGVGCLPVSPCLSLSLSLSLSPSPSLSFSLSFLFSHDLCLDYSESSESSRSSASMASFWAPACGACCCRATR